MRILAPNETVFSAIIAKAAGDGNVPHSPVSDTYIVGVNSVVVRNGFYSRGSFKDNAEPWQPYLFGEGQFFKHKEAPHLYYCSNDRAYWYEEEDESIHSVPYFLYSYMEQTPDLIYLTDHLGEPIDDKVAGSNMSRKYRRVI